MDTPTNSEAKKIAAAIDVVLVLADAIREAQQIPSGVLYGMLLGKVSLEGYQSVIGVLKRAGLVSEANHLLTWVGPEVGS
jgi:hypothetical protein